MAHHSEKDSEEDYVSMVADMTNPSNKGTIAMLKQLLSQMGHSESQNDTDFCEEDKEEFDAVMARCHTAEANAWGLQHALEASEESLMRALEEVSQLTERARFAENQRMAEKKAGQLAVEELREQVEELEEQLRMRQPCKCAALQAQVCDLQAEAVVETEAHERCSELLSENAQLIQEKERLGKVVKQLQEAQHELHTLRTSEARVQGENSALQAQNRRYEELLKETTDALCEQRSVAAALRDAVDCQDADASNDCSLGAEQSMAEMEHLVKDLSEASSELREVAKSQAPSQQITQAFMDSLRDAIKEQVAQEMTQIREVLSPPSTPQHCRAAESLGMSDSPNAVIELDLAAKAEAQSIRDYLEVGFEERTTHRAQDLKHLKLAFGTVSGEFVRSMADIKHNLGRLANLVGKDADGNGGEEEEEEGLPSIVKEMQRVELRAQRCAQHLFGQMHLVPLYEKESACRENAFQYISAPEYVLALQRNVAKCKSKLQRAARDKQAALEKCTKAWQGALQTAAKRISETANRDQQLLKNVQILMRQHRAPM